MPNFGARYAPRMVTVGTSLHCELARWILDRLGVPYREQNHIPVLHLLPLWLAGGHINVPVLVVAETSLLEASGILDYYEARGRPEDCLWPADPAQRAEAHQLFQLFNVTLADAARSWAYGFLLPLGRVVRPLWSIATPRIERWILRLAYPLIASVMRHALGITKNSEPKDRATLEKVFDQVEAKLADGRRYLLGDRISAADIAFAALGAPAVLPDLYGGPLPHRSQCPPEMREGVERFRNRPAGKFILRLYEEDRPLLSSRIAPEDIPGWLAASKAQIAAALTGTLVQRAAFAILRRCAPILVFKGAAVLARYDDVVAALSRDQFFSVVPTNGPRTNRDNGPFVLSMDPSPRHDREKNLLNQVMERHDLERIRALAAASSAELVEAAKPMGRIDVVGGLSRVAPVRVVAAYFGVPGPNEGAMKRWTRDLFHDIFLNVSDDLDIQQPAVEAALEWRLYLERFLAQEKAAMAAGPNGRTDTVLRRMLKLQDPSRPWLDDDAVIRNISGLILGAVDTTSKIVVHSLNQLLLRPDALRRAAEAAAAGDSETVSKYAFEALRFDPHNPVLIRSCPADSALASGISPQRTIPAGSTVYASTLSAMFDSAAFPHPMQFRADRDPRRYLHFGLGTHACQGRSVSGVQAPEILAALLRLKNLRPATVNGWIAYDGPFPDRFVVEFDA